MLRCQAAPTSPYMASGRTLGGGRVLCSRKYGTPCSEVNSQSILGQALSDLIMASEAKVTVANQRERTLNEILAEINGPSRERYRFNDYYVSVFAVDQSGCSSSPVSEGGCCVAHGGDASFVGKTWQQVLNAQSITSILGIDLHQRLIAVANSGGAWIDHTWAQASGQVQTKRAWATRFRDGSTEYYVVVDYFKTAPPPTCNGCPSNMECTEQSQEFCKVIPETWFDEHGALVIVGGVAFVLISLLFCKYAASKRSKKRRLNALNQKLDETVEEMKNQMTGMYKVVHPMPRRSAFGAQSEGAVSEEHVLLQERTSAQLRASHPDDVALERPRPRTPPKKRPAAGPAVFGDVQRPQEGGGKTRRAAAREEAKALQNEMDAKGKMSASDRVALEGGGQAYPLI